MSEPVIVHPVSAPLVGVHCPEGDKSITHRALFLGALNAGRTRIVHPSRAADCRSTREFLSALGYDIRETADGWEMQGGARIDHDAIVELDCGNSGTTARLGLGFLTGEAGVFRVSGDASLRSRPMDRVAAPLRRLGCAIDTTDGRLPALVTSDGNPGAPVDEIFEAASAQVHAALALAALRSRSGITIRRTAAMRDHTLRMLGAFGALEPGDSENGVDRIRPVTIDREVELVVPGDISSASFFITAALLVPGSSLVIERVGLNESRIVFLQALREMGADIRWTITEDDSPEPHGTVLVRHCAVLRGIDLTDGGVETEIPVTGMIDELPLLALVGAVANGATIVRRASELRVKESDRISATLSILAALGLSCIEHDDGFEIHGPQTIRGGATVDHAGDHRLCMLAAIAALAATEPVTIPEPNVASVSCPGFWDELERLAGLR